MDGVDIADLDSVISAGVGLIAGGESLDADMSVLVGEISRYEGPEVLGDDDFAARFLHAVYHRPVQEGNGTLPTAEAVKAFGASRGGRPSIGTTAQENGGYVVSTMAALSSVDSANASDMAAFGAPA